jgi:hypothetical protein
MLEFKLSNIKRILQRIYASIGAHNKPRNINSLFDPHLLCNPKFHDFLDQSPSTCCTPPHPVSLRSFSSFRQLQDSLKIPSFFEALQLNFCVQLYPVHATWPTYIVPIDFITVIIIYNLLKARFHHALLQTILVLAFVTGAVFQWRLLQSTNRASGVENNAQGRPC